MAALLPMAADLLFGVSAKLSLPAAATFILGGCGAVIALLFWLAWQRKGGRLMMLAALGQLGISSFLMQRMRSNGKSDSSLWSIGALIAVLPGLVTMACWIATTYSRRGTVVFVTRTLPLAAMGATCSLLSLVLQPLSTRTLCLALIMAALGAILGPEVCPLPLVLLRKRDWLPLEGYRDRLWDEGLMAVITPSGAEVKAVWDLGKVVLYVLGGLLIMVFWPAATSFFGLEGSQTQQMLTMRVGVPAPT